MAATLVVVGDARRAGPSLIDAVGRPAGATILDLEGHPQPAEAMLAAGSPGLDAYLLVVAADVGITPQTLEHAALLRALGVETGLAVATRADLADLPCVLQKIGQLVPDRPAHAVSVASGAGSTRCAPRSPTCSPAFGRAGRRRPPCTPGTGRRWSRG